MGPHFFARLIYEASKKVGAPFVMGVPCST